MMCESFEVMASGTLVGMVPAAFVNACMSTDQCLPILVEWADLGRGAWNRPLPSASCLCAGVWGQARKGAASSHLRTPGQATMNPRGRATLQRGIRSINCNGPAVIVRKERRWNTTSVSRETTGRFGFGVWKRYRCEIHERCCVLRCFRWLTPKR